MTNDSLYKATAEKIENKIKFYDERLKSFDEKSDAGLVKLTQDLYDYYNLELSALYDYWNDEIPYEDYLNECK